MRTAPDHPPHARTAGLTRRIPLNFFGMPFGLTGLATCWSTAAGYGLVPAAVGEALAALAGLVWLVLVTAYLRCAVAIRGALRRDLGDRLLSPFAALVPLTPMLLCATALRPHAAMPARVAVDVLVAAVVLLGGWLTGDWIYGPLRVDQVHPGYLLPTVAGGLIAGAAAAMVGQPRLGYVLAGLGGVCWLALGSIVLARLLTRPLPPVALLPTLAIEMAPPAVASLAWFALAGDRLGPVAEALGGYTLLMVLAQLRLVPCYLRLRFTPGFWAFAFSSAAVATIGLHWLHDAAPPGGRWGAYAVLVVISVFIGGLAARTTRAFVGGQLLPPVTALFPDPNLSDREPAHV
ncbi:C4-dicarboxylate transporter/malic acid transport protein [Pseudofrankia inefficax]|uniref:C4-dicarboxylate transporter/malic acid transport protein n=1 Tax=Pseudofrankia inefficax (strain DSM 45817 / CECT 9037 / DDB 130130 / EuI1c) TaxID=298654 RepID=E3J9S3_PSEI1|nr:C4-dicarboxylate transporter/malic acid transport protein [Pseudofrankia inefficax]ADP84576.1 C4-dicarboxylate transporter/malic acid transport protein [Pseudofrankia inefficax]